MITDIRIIATRIVGGSEEIEIVAEISEKNVPFGVDKRTKLVNGFFNGFDLFKKEIETFCKSEE